MIPTITIKFYSDPGHGWGAVKRKLLIDSGVAEQISTYSYQKGDTVYLEEDCDLPKFASAMLYQKGIRVEYNDKYTDRRSAIRNYESFKA